MTPSRKRRLTKIAEATRQLESVALSYRDLALRASPDPTSANRLHQRDWSALYYLSRLARKAP